jgi:hypothetical protein
MAARARKETEPFLAELAGRAVELERAARRLSRSLIEPVGHRPFEEEIADCKQAFVAFLKRRKVREVNKYGWVLLRAIFWGQMETRKGKRPTSQSIKHKQFCYPPTDLSQHGRSARFPVSRTIDLHKGTWHLEPAHGGNCIT